MRPQRMTYDMADHSQDDENKHVPWGIKSKYPNPCIYGALVARAQRNIVNESRILSPATYPNEFALFWFMEHGFIPDRTSEGIGIDQKAAKKFIRSYNKACAKVNSPYVELA